MPLPPPPAAALDEEREAEFGTRLCRERLRVPGTDTRSDRHALLDREGAGADLVAHQTDSVRVGADEGETGRGHALGETGVLGQEAVAGMNGLRRGALRGSNDLCLVEVGCSGHVSLEACTASSASFTCGAPRSSW